MTFRIAVPKERHPGERRVALVPEVVARLVKIGLTVTIESGAGAGAHFTDADYTAAGAAIASDRARLLQQAQLTCKVQPPEPDEIESLAEASIFCGFIFPHRFPERAARLAERRITCFAMELVPRVTRGQPMDALSSQSTVAGYQAAVLAAAASGRFFPMLTTAAGTIRPAKVLVLGAGVAGLQAIATARRLGAVVEAYDVRRITKEQVKSLGARFLDSPIEAEAPGGYARELSPEERARVQEMIARHVGQSDVVITTAQVPGRPSPRLITEAMVGGMKPGSIIVDLGADGGGNCELTKPGATVEWRGITIYGPVNLASQLPTHASEMYARNLYHLVTLLTKGGTTGEPDWNDEICAGAVLTHHGQIRYEPGWCLVPPREVTS